MTRVYYQLIIIALLANFQSLKIIVADEYLYQKFHVGLGEYLYSQTNVKDFGCWNKNCPDFGIMGNGNIFVKELRGKSRRALLKCKTCGSCFCETHGTPIFGLKTPMNEIANALSLIPELRSIRAVARHTNHKADTILSWIELVNNNINEFNEYFSKNLNYSQDQLNELWLYIKQRKRGSNNEKMLRKVGEE